MNKFNRGRTTRDDLLNHGAATSNLNYCDKHSHDREDRGLVLDTVSKPTERLTVADCTDRDTEDVRRDDKEEGCKGTADAKIKPSSSSPPPHIIRHHSTKAHITSSLNHPLRPLSCHLSSATTSSTPVFQPLRLAGSGTDRETALL